MTIPEIADPIPPNPDSPEPYEVIERVNIGTAAVVYRAVQTASQKEVLFKVFSPAATHPMDTERVVMMRPALMQLKHPHIAPVLDLYEDDEGCVLVIPYLVGCGGNSFPHQGKLSQIATFQVATQLCSTLLAGEHLSFPHGDIKPSNLAIADRESQGFFIQLQDWGLSLCRDDQPHETLQHLAPERLQGYPASIQSDLFSIGATLWFLLTGTHAVEGQTRQDFAAAWAKFDGQKLVKLRPDLNVHFLEWLGWIMRINPLDRPTSAAEAMSVLNQVVAYATNNPAIAPPETVYEAPVPQTTLKDKIRTGIIGLTVLSMLIFAFTRWAESKWGPEWPQEIKHIWSGN
jgi:serine/threonine protein kinase